MTPQPGEGGPTLNQVRRALAQTLHGLQVPDGGVQPLTGYPFVPDNPALPALIVARPRIAWTHLALSPGIDDTWTLELWLLLVRTDTPVNEEQLGHFITGTGPASIRQRLEASRTIRHDYLGLADAKLRNLRLQTADARFEAAGLNHLGAAYTIEALIPATIPPPDREA